jgi:hypothetical protein
MKWYQFPITFRYKKDGGEQTATLVSHYCPELNLRFTQHPELSDKSILIDSLGVTDVAMSASDLAKVFDANRN